MHSRALVLGAALFALPGFAADAAGQQAQRPGAADALTLVYDREIFLYVGRARRDPFLPLTNENEMGPRFESLSLRGIIYSTGRQGSVAMLGDAGGRIYRARVGDAIGNATVVEIGPMRVVFAVENFGSIRQEMLELQRNQGVRP